MDLNRLHPGLLPQERLKQTCVSGVAGVEVALMPSEFLEALPSLLLLPAGEGRVEGEHNSNC